MKKACLIIVLAVLAVLAVSIAILVFRELPPLFNSGVKLVDTTRGKTPICELHNVPMTIRNVDGACCKSPGWNAPCSSVAAPAHAGFTEADDFMEYTVAQKEKFPHHWDIPYFMGMCGVHFFTKSFVVRVYECEKCAQASDSWIEEYKESKIEKNNKKSHRSP